MGASSSVAAACANTHPPEALLNRPQELGAALLAVVVLYLFETRFITTRCRQETQRIYSIVKFSAPIALLALAGIPLLVGSIYLPSVPPPTLSLSDPKYVVHYWLLALLYLMAYALEEALQLTRPMYGSLSDKFREGLNRVAALDIVLFVACTDCDSLNFWLIIALSMARFIKQLLCEVNFGSFHDLIQLASLGPVSWRLAQLALALHSAGLPMLPTAALGVLILNQLDKIARSRALGGNLQFHGKTI